MWCCCTTIMPMPRRHCPILSRLHDAMDLPSAAWRRNALMDKSVSPLAKLEQAIGAKTARVGVIGLGYVGLPLIQAFVAAGCHTMGFDIDDRKVQQLRAGKSYIKHIPAEAIARSIAEQRFEPTSDM